MVDNFDNDDEHVFANFNTIKREFPASGESSQKDGTNLKPQPKKPQPRKIQNSYAKSGPLPLENSVSDVSLLPFSSSSLSSHSISVPSSSFSRREFQTTGGLRDRVNDNVSLALWGNFNY